MTLARAIVRAWELPLLLASAALFMLPGVPIDGDVLKGAALALFLAPVLLVSLAAREGTAAAAFVRSGGGRLYVGSVLAAVIGGLASGAYAGAVPSAVIDRVIVVALSLLAASLGAVAARRHPDALAGALLLAGGVSALVALAQALGWETLYSPPPELTAGVKEIVAFMGNSTRAGALLALAVPALTAVALARGAGTSWRLARASPEDGDATPHAAPRRVTPTLVVLGLVVAALMLTQARGARLAALAGAGAVLWAHRPSRSAMVRVGVPLGLGLVLALVIGGPDVLLARKLPTSDAIVSGHDVTTNVRLSLWRATSVMVADRPWFGHGLGTFRKEFPAYREAGEASLPGLHGAPTVAWHPHDEPLLAFAEGGWLGGLLLVAFLVSTLWRAWTVQRRDRAPGDLVALGVFVAGLVAGLLQDAWVSPGTGLFVFAAAGHTWAPLAPHPDDERHRGVALAVALVLAAALALLAWPRWRAHYGAWDFVKRAEEVGAILPEHFDVLARAAAAAPRDEDVQKMTRQVGLQLLAALPPERRADVSRVLADVVLRLQALGATGP